MKTNELGRFMDRENEDELGNNMLMRLIEEGLDGLQANDDVYIFYFFMLIKYVGLLLHRNKAGETVLDIILRKSDDDPLLVPRSYDLLNQIARLPVNQQAMIFKNLDQEGQEDAHLLSGYLLRQLDAYDETSLQINFEKAYVAQQALVTLYKKGNNAMKDLLQAHKWTLKLRILPHTSEGLKLYKKIMDPGLPGNSEGYISQLDSELVGTRHRFTTHNTKISTEKAKEELEEFINRL